MTSLSDARLLRGFPYDETHKLSPKSTNVSKWSTTEYKNVSKWLEIRHINCMDDQKFPTEKLETGHFLKTTDVSDFI